MVRLGLSRFGKIFLAIAMGCGASQNSGCRMRTQSEQLLPRDSEVKGLARTGSVQHFSDRQLIEYIDGGAELYFAYGFVEMAGCRYRLSDGSSATIEIYEMDRSENAYGVYSLDTEGFHPEVGHEATYAAGLLKFWKDRFFVRIMAENDSPETKQTLTGVGTTIANKIDEQGGKPLIVRYVPASGVVPDSLQFFHKQICLNNIYYIADENLLRLSESTDAIAYRYHVGDASVRVFLVQYPSDVAASEAFQNFVEMYLERDSGDPLVVKEIEDGTFCGAKQTDRFVALAFEASDRGTCLRILETASSDLGRAVSNEEETG